MNQIQYQIKSRIGPLYLVASQKALQGIFFDKQPIKLLKKLDSSKPEQKIVAQAACQLEEYFSGQRKKFDVTFDLSGTAFQRKVWSELSNIPYGKTVSYREIAQRIKKPKAMRAVGSANGKNPACIIIPCHRVIAADGSIGGYSGGIDIKKKLLKLEGISGNVRDY